MRLTSSAAVPSPPDGDQRPQPPLGVPGVGLDGHLIEVGQHLGDKPGLVKQGHESVDLWPGGGRPSFRTNRHHHMVGSSRQHGRGLRQNSRLS